MDALDRYLNRVAYKFPKGYPDSDEDMAMLYEMVNALIKEEEEEVEVEDTTQTTPQTSPPSGGSELYNDTIRYALYGRDYKDKPIPTPKGKYPYRTSTFNITVNSADKETFTKLFPVKPPKVGKEIGTAGSLGVGNGEIALYWLYNFSKSANVEEGRDGDDPDLFFNGNGVEVKSWNSDVGLKGLGRFGADKENLALLSLIFGFSALVSVLEDGKAPSKTVNPTNFKGKQLVEAMEKVKEFKELLDENNSLATDYSLFGNIKSNVDKVYSALGASADSSAEEMARSMAVKLLEPKLSRKPGDGNHLANVKEDGNIKFFHIDFDKLKKSEDLLADFETKQSALKLNFDKIWG